MDGKRLAEEWATILGDKPLRRMTYEEFFRDLFTKGYFTTSEIAERMYHDRRHATVRKIRRYAKELQDRNIIQKRRAGVSGFWYYEFTDWWQALLIETYKALKRSRS